MLSAGEMMRYDVVAVDPFTPATAAIRLFDEYAVNVIAAVDHGIVAGALFRSDLIRRLLLPTPFGHPAET